jgi:hypothetical protein
MFTRVTETIFKDTFKAINPDQFTRAGLVALFDYLENCENETGQEMAFNATDISCKFTEYENWTEFNIEYGSLIDDEEIQPGDFEKLQDHTTVICFGESSFIIRTF